MLAGVGAADDVRALAGSVGDGEGVGQALRGGGDDGTTRAGLPVQEKVGRFGQGGRAGDDEGLKVETELKELRFR